MDFCPQYLILKLIPDLGGADDVKSALARSLARSIDLYTFL